MSSWLSHDHIAGAKGGPAAGARWLDVLPSSIMSAKGPKLWAAATSTAGQSAWSQQQNGSLGTLLRAALFPNLPAWLQTTCYACRILALLIVAPILLIALVDFAEYAVVRTLGLRRRKVRVKRTTDRQEHRGLRLSPAQMQNRGAPAPAPLLSPGAYDAEALLRHRARSASAASLEAILEWQRTGGSFARVSEVRQAAGSGGGVGGGGGGAVTPDEEPKSPVLARANVGVDGPLGLSESEAEDSGTESREGSPPVMRKGLKSSRLTLTPMHRQGKPKADDTGTSSSTAGDTHMDSTMRHAAAAAAADLEPYLEIPHHAP
ncbi:unnamed protein product [Parajaminaea phylloscopi]